VNAKKWMWAILALVLALTAFAGAALAASELPYRIFWSTRPTEVQGPDEVYFVEAEGTKLLCVWDEGRFDCEPAAVSPSGQAAVAATPTQGAGGGIHKAAPTPTATPSSAVGTAPPATQQPSP
jgi:hypothetical protein